MTEHSGDWLLIGLSFFILCPYTFIIMDRLSLEMDNPAIYHHGQNLAWFFFAEGVLGVASELSRTIERINCWHWRKLLFVHKRT